MSGGVDSAACLDFYLSTGRTSEALHVTYGQPAARQELLSARSIAAYYRVPFRALRLEGAVPKRSGEIPGRNAFLLAAGLMEVQDSVSVISLGLHGMSDYPDCSKEFLEHVQFIAESATARKIRIAAPFIDWSKSEVYRYCLERRVPLELTHSCEAADRPCGVCASCMDREALDASWPR
ncbi:MAG: 7-cyano-7-deazaguanine synthase [Bacillota bacterium]|nr:7-cyano-7-deazaguanine synthase [Bacillota bacterium]